MKIRNGFVSNSSSSSFVIVNAKKGYEKLEPTQDSVYKIGNCGTTEFGWGVEDITDIHSRINFALIQALLTNREDWIGMIENVILENSDSIKELEFSITVDYNNKEKIHGYIDHQSSACEGENVEIFKNKKNLKDFIFGKNSSIHLDNDNH